MKELLKNSVLVIGSLVFSLVVAEIVCRIIVQNEPEGPEIVSINLYDMEWVEDIGYMLKANHSYRAQKYAISEKGSKEKNI